MTPRKNISGERDPADLSDPSQNRSAPARRADPNQSVEHAFALLKLFASVHEPLGVAEISRKLGVPLGTGHRVVSTLCDAGYLDQQREGGKYEPGIRVRELLLALYSRFPLRAAATPTLRKLASTSGQSASLTVALGRNHLRIAGIPARQILSRPLMIGRANMLHEGIIGRTILAFRSNAATFVDGAALESAERSALKKELDQIRREGYGHAERGPLRIVAFPVRNSNDEALGAVAMEGAIVHFQGPTAHKVAQWKKIIAELEQQCRENPDLGRGPFDHIPDDELRLATVEGPSHE